MDSRIYEYITQLNRLSKEIYGEEWRISAILGEADFAPEQISRLQQEAIRPFLDRIDLALRTVLSLYPEGARRIDVLYHRYGLFGCAKESLRSIGARCGLSGESVRLLQKQILNQLKYNAYSVAVTNAAAHTLGVEVPQAWIRFPLAARPEQNQGMPTEPPMRALSKSRKSKQPFSMTLEMREKYRPSDTAVRLSAFIKSVNALKEKDMSYLRRKTVTAFLIQAGLLEYFQTEDGRWAKKPTADGISMGIFRAWQIGERGSYMVTLYSKEAQEFLVDNMEMILSGNAPLETDCAEKTELDLIKG